MGINTSTRSAALVLSTLLALAASVSSASAEAVIRPAVEVAHRYPAPTVEPKGSRARAGVPAVTTHATAFQKKPRIAKGTGKASKKLLVRDLIVGHGKKVGSDATVDVRYVGVLYVNGKEFDSSWTRGLDPATFPLRDVIPGFAGGLIGMKAGGRREIVIPPKYGYGSTENSGIPANSTLVFVVDLVRIR